MNYNEHHTLTHSTKILSVFDYIDYNYTTGELFLKKNKRRLLPNEDNMVIVSVDNIRIKMKYDRLCWSIYHKTALIPDQVIFHKDLNDSNNKISNLCVVPKKEYSKIKEALKNISGDLRIIPHHSDAFSCVLEYRSAGRIRREVIEDVSVARKKMLKLQLKYLKYLSKYITTD